MTQKTLDNVESVAVEDKPTISQQSREIKRDPDEHRQRPYEQGDEEDQVPCQVATEHQTRNGGVHGVQ